MHELLRLPEASDAAALFPLIHRTSVTHGIAWDGPESRDDYTARLTEIADEAWRGERHFFTILEPSSGAPIGSCDVRPDDAGFRASVGIWLAESHQGRGIGTRTIAELVSYAWTRLGLHRLEADVFVGNGASRRSFEKNGFELEGTIRSAMVKRGVPRDMWLLALLNPKSRFWPPLS